MMRINLLPPEILERRNAERRILWVLLAAAGVAVVLVGVFGVAYFNLDARREELASVQQQVKAAETQAAQLAIFEERAGELETRRQTVELALGSRVDWATILTEMSLVMPDDMWVQSMTVAENGGVAIEGYAVNPPGDDPDAGMKSIAKVLVRLADLDGVYDVWLTHSVKQDYSQEGYEEQPCVQFTITANIGDPTEATQ